ncbi:hypothetical protein PMAYCL1PPCAC_22810, partial [Pristionchus mayeri]
NEMYLYNSDTSSLSCGNGIPGGRCFGRGCRCCSSRCRGEDDRTARLAAVLQFHRGGVVSARAERWRSSIPASAVGILIDAFSESGSSPGRRLGTVPVAESASDSAVHLAHVHRVASVRTESIRLPRGTRGTVVSSALGGDSRNESEKGYGSQQRIHAGE